MELDIDRLPRRVIGARKLSLSGEGEARHLGGGRHELKMDPKGREWVRKMDAKEGSKAVRSV